MKRFAQLYRELDATTSTHAKLAALTRYYATAPAADAAWATYFLAGGKLRQLVPRSVMADAALRASGLPTWLFDECRIAVGDFAETVANVLPGKAVEAENDAGLASWMSERLIPLRDMEPETAGKQLTEYWNYLDRDSRFLLTKLIGGAFRVGVSRLLVQRALALHSGMDAKIIAQRMMGYTDKATSATAERYLALVDAAAVHRASGQPYPFFLAHALSAPAETLGNHQDWLVEWKYDGIRAQIVRHGPSVTVWSRGEELITDRFPEAVAIGQSMAEGTVLDGELLAWEGDSPLPFAVMQKRIGRKNLTPKILAAAPVSFVAYDILEEEGHDLRALPQKERRMRLESMVSQIRVTNPSLPLQVSPCVEAADWKNLDAMRQNSRALGVEGLMLKRLDAAYGVGRTKDVGTWWKWKTDPYTVDCVLIYAQHGSGRRASLYTDFTFAVWDRAVARDEVDPGQSTRESDARRLVPFAKAYSGLTDEEIRAVDGIVRRTTIEKFGPVRSVTPTLVFELGFEDIQASSRHKSGIAVRFPRILRWRTDKPVEEADTLAELQLLLETKKTLAEVRASRR